MDFDEQNWDAARFLVSNSSFFCIARKKSYTAITLHVNIVFIEFAFVIS